MKHQWNTFFILVFIIFMLMSITYTSEVQVSNAANGFKYFMPLVFFLLLLSTVGIIIIRLKYGWDGRSIKSVEVYPPDQLSSLDVGFTYYGKMKAKEFTSLFLYLANKGYIDIEEVENKIESSIIYELFQKKVKARGKMAILIKNREYDGDHDMERSFMDAMFRYGDQVYLSGLITDIDYSYRSTEFTKIVRNLMNEGNNREEKRLALFDATADKMCLIGFFLLFTAWILFRLLIIMLLDGNDIEVELVLVSLAPIIILGVITRLILGFIIGSKDNRATWGGGVVIMLTAFFFLMRALKLTDLLGSIMETITFPALYPLGLLCVVLAIGFAGGQEKRTAYGRELYWRIRSFRNFLLTAKKSTLEALLRENPSYFYDILPYAYVLNVSKEWIDKFKSIDLDPPDWYYSVNEFDSAAFCRNIICIMNGADESIYPTRNVNN